LRLALRTKQKIQRGALNPQPELPLRPKPTLPRVPISLPTKNIAGLRENFHRVEGSSKGGAQWNIR